MIPCLIAQPQPTKSKSERPRANEVDFLSDETTRDWEVGRDDEERYIFKLILLMLLVLVLPAILMLLYIVLTPDAFQYNITPKQDFSSWHPGKSF